jgi:hypothetical protein
MAKPRQPLSGTAQPVRTQRGHPGKHTGPGQRAPQRQRVIIITEFDAGDDLNDPDKPTLTKIVHEFVHVNKQLRANGSGGLNGNGCDRDRR